MLKEPRPGRVKSRLGRDIGMVAAAWWFRRQAKSLIRGVQDPRWDLVLAVSPDIPGLRSRVWPSWISRLPQGTGTLGDRMRRILKTRPPGPICIIGADIPTVTRADIQQAFSCLGDADAVIGPAEDGGYWLIGLKRIRATPPSIFNDVRWSTAHALRDTRATLPGWTIAQAATHADVDTAGDLERSESRSNQTRQQLQSHTSAAF